MMKKPLGSKAYGSIPHLSGSRLGPGDHHCHAGQERICFEGGRDKKGRPHRVIVTEKLDGSNVAVARVDGEIVALGRNGYRAETSPHKQHQIFAQWVAHNKWGALPERWRVSGEWMLQAHGTLYNPSSPLIAFDVFDEANKRIPHDDARTLFAALDLEGAAVVSDGPGCGINPALEAAGAFGNHGATEQIEGCVWRVETGGVFNFLTKYVRPEKVDGKYFTPEGHADVFMCDPMKSNSQGE
ncbi:MAG: RNA ligase family protein [Pikeienuella sp.]